MTRWIGGDGARPKIDLPSTTPHSLSTPNGSDFSASSLSLGADHATRSLIALGVIKYSSISGVITGLSATINGVTASTATAQVQSWFSTSLGLHCFIAHVRSPTGSSGNVALSYTGGGSLSSPNGQVYIYRCRFVRDLNALDAQAVASNSASPLSTTLNVTKSASLVLGVGIDSVSGAGIPTWTATGITLESLSLGVGFSYGWLFGKQDNVAANASYGVSMTPSVANNRMMLACAFR